MTAASSAGEPPGSKRPPALSATGPPGPEWTEKRVAEASAAELAAGRLPMRAQWRLAEQHERAERGGPGAFTSDLTVEEFAAVRSVGFSPVGQVMGSAVYNVGWSYTGCGYGFTPGYGGPGPWQTTRWGGAPVVPVPATQKLLSEARHRSVSRMRQECAALGGDGVVGVRLMIRPFHDIGMEFFAVGTAVRAQGRTRPKVPFTSDLTGQDFAKLLRAGWVPVALVQGVAAMIRHRDMYQAAQSASWYNQELVGSTQLVHEARSRARDALTVDAQHAGGESVVLRDTVLQVYERRCATGGEGEDLHANAYLWGTAIVRFRPAHAGTRRLADPAQVLAHEMSDAPLQILRLNR